MVEEGKYVAIQYTGKFDDGQVFDSSTQEQPFEFKAGSGMVIPGLDNGIMGMKVEEEKDLVIPPEEAYGEYDEKLIYTFPIEEVRQQFEPQVGMTIGVQLDNGAQVPALIKEVTDSEIFLDMNHPLAGKTLHFNIKVMEVNDEPKFAPADGCSGCSDESDGCSC
jgi:peptidylprolyl isomerase